MNPPDKISFSIVVDRTLRALARPKDYWRDLGALFVDMAKEIPQDKLDEIIARHPLAMKIVEILPE